MIGSFDMESLEANRRKQTKPFFDLPAELRITIYEQAFSTYSGHINIISRRDHEHGYSQKAALGPLELLLVSKRVESEVRKMMFWHFTVFMPPRLSGWSLKKLTSNTTLRSIIVDLDSYKSPVSLITDLGDLDTLEELEVRTSSDTCWPTLLLCLSQPDLFPQLRKLKVVNLRLLGRSPPSSSSPRRLVKYRQIVPEFFSRSVLCLGTFDDVDEWRDEVEAFLMDAENLTMALERDCPDRELHVCVRPSIKQDTQICRKLAHWYHHGGEEATMQKLGRCEVLSNIYSEG